MKIEKTEKCSKQAETEKLVAFLEEVHETLNWDKETVDKVIKRVKDYEKISNLLDYLQRKFASILWEGRIKI